MEKVPKHASVLDHQTDLPRLVEDGIGVQLQCPGIALLVLIVVLQDDGLFHPARGISITKHSITGSGLGFIRLGGRVGHDDGVIGNIDHIKWVIKRIRTDFVQVYLEIRRALVALYNERRKKMTFTLAREAL